ncbi:MAG: TetR/AcrR family transcriptional regulator [Bacilli bacterium]|jgi:AcrR family transcriptional regulator|nr:TetR/AcrR family transcriptional regulator [Bacilli bacterium]
MENKVLTIDELKIRKESKVLSRTKTKRKKSIVDTAYKLIFENGISETAMNDIADACHITRRTIYNYFATKTTLLNYLMVEATKEVDPDFHVNYDYELNGLENFDKALETNFEAYYNNIDKFMFITEVRIYLSYQKYENDYKDESLKMHESFVLELVNIIERGYEDGSITKKDSDTHELARAIYQGIYGYLSAITVGRNISKEKYDYKCKVYKNIILGYLKA